MLVKDDPEPTAHGAPQVFLSSWEHRAALLYGSDGFKSSPGSEWYELLEAPRGRGAATAKPAGSENCNYTAEQH